MNGKNLHSGHRGRLRKRLIESDGKGICEHELLELLLFYALPRVNTNETAHQLIRQFGSLEAVLSAAPDELSRIPGVSTSASRFLKLVHRLCMRYSADTGRLIRFSGEAGIQDYFRDYFAGTSSDICLLIEISPRLELTDTVSFPAADVLTPRRIAEVALRKRFRRIVIGMNRPDCPPTPTPDDYALARGVSELLTPLGTVLADYIVCGRGGTFSMHSSGAFSFTEG